MIKVAWFAYPRYKRPDLRFLLREVAECTTHLRQYGLRGVATVHVAMRQVSRPVLRVAIVPTLPFEKSWGNGTFIVPIAEYFV